MVKIEAVIHPSRVERAKVSLSQFSVLSFLISAVARQHSDDPPAASRTAKLEIVASDQDADDIVNAIISALRPASGTLVVSRLADMVNIRSGVHHQSLSGAVR